MTKHNINNDLETITAIIGNLANVKLEQGKKWQVNIDTKVISYPNNSQTIKADGRHLTDSAIGCFLHESAHLAYTTSNTEIDRKLKTKYKTTADKIFYLLNSLEDLRIERKLIDRYKGAKYYLNEAQASTLTSLASLDKNALPLETRHNLLPHFLTKTNKFIPSQISAEFLANTPSEINKLFTAQKIKAIDKMLDAKTTAKLFSEIEKHLLDDYLKLLNIKPADRKQMIKDIKQQLQKKPNGKKNNIKQSSKEKIKKGAQKYKSNNFFAKQEKKYNSDNLDRLITESRPLINKTRRAISILKDKEFRRDEINKTSGKIDNKKLTRLFTTQENQAPRVFKRVNKNERESKDIIVSILADISGSMSGERALNCAVAVNVLAQALTQLKKPFSIFAFNTKFKIIKNFNNRYNITQANELRLADYGTKLFTPLYRTLQITKSYKKDKRPIIFIFSDGETDHAGGQDENGKNLSYNFNDTEKLKKEIGADIIPVEIDSNGLSEYYKNAKRINDASELPDLLIKYLNALAGKRAR